jgi:hypothetical protein
MARERRADRRADTGDFVLGLQHRPAVFEQLLAQELHDLG